MKTVWECAKDARWPGALIVSLVCATGWACTASSEEVQPPGDDFYFPTGVALAPQGDVLGVANANSDLRFDSGTLSLVDMGEVRAILEAWLEGDSVPEGRDCEVEPGEPQLLTCGAPEVIGDEGSVRIGNFATGVAFQELASGDLRAFLPVRGDPSVTWVDVEPEAGSLACGGTGSHPRCDEAHRIRHVQEDSSIDSLPSEPFGLFVDSGNEYAVVTHLARGGVSLVHAPAGGETPVLADVLRGVFRPDSQGISSAVGVAGRRPGDPSDEIYVTSRSEASMLSLFVVRGEGLPELATGRRTDLRDLGRPANNARGIAFNAEGTRAYVVNRSPPALQVFDTRIDRHGQPANEPIGSVGLCREASNAAVADTGRGERVYVACFRDNQVWAIDPSSLVLESTISVGRGPHGLALSEEDSLLFVTNFLGDTLSVVDLEEGSGTENRAVLRLGFGGRRTTQ